MRHTSKHYGSHMLSVCDAYKVEIFIGGDSQKALDICEAYCTSVGLCVTVEPTMYVYRGGRCEGVRVGLINYPRFPKSQEKIRMQANELAELLLTGLGQGSYTVQDGETAMFYSQRKEDGCNG